MTEVELTVSLKISVARRQTAYGHQRNALPALHLLGGSGKRLATN
jgi:hypothetical protein